jgi:hypothetical protein
MSRHLAYRPRYRNLRSLTPLPLPTRKSFSRVRWTYRQQDITSYRRPPLGQRLLAIPFPRFVHSVIVRRA